MYERSAIVLEKYIDKILEFDKQFNLKKNSEDYINLVNETDNYQTIEDEDLKIIQDFDDTVRRIERIQKEQQKLSKENKKIEDERTQLFIDLGEDEKVLDTKIRKTESIIDKNNEKLKQLREDFIENLEDFSKKQKNRNKCDKQRRATEEKYLNYVKKIHNDFEKIDVKDMAILKDFISSEKEQVKQEALNIMTKNGKNERIPFNQDVLRKVINNRVDIAEKEAECYILAYDKMKRLLAQTDGEIIKLDKYKKVLKDISVKLAFLKAQREYIVGFLDYERMTVISGPKAHKKMMVDACNNFELDMMQIKKLYELIIKETTNKATKSDYDKLYNKNYLKNIEDKEKNFEKEANNVDIAVGTLINSNYWRIDGIKNIYMVFQEEVSEKFNRDLSEYRIEDIEEQDEEENTNEYYQEEQDEYYDDENNEDEYYEDEDEFYDDDEYYEEDDDDEYYDEEDDGEYYDEEDDDEYYDEDDDEEYYDEEDGTEQFEEIDGDDLDKLIKNSRKKGKHSAENKDNKGLFNKFFKK